MSQRVKASTTSAAPQETTSIFRGRSGASDIRGSMVGGYRIEQEIGRGATSIVYLATHPILKTRAAVKVLHHELSVRADLNERFIVEARAVAALQHPHIVQIYDLVPLADGRLCTVMEYVEGPTLESLGKEQLAPRRVRAILLQLCSALAAAHQRGIVHRDLKAQNVVLLSGSTRDHVKLLDFGLAKAEANESGLTSPGMVLGTPHYMAPEQVLGEQVDRRADVYALGVLAYRLLTGAVPFDGSPAEVMFHHVRTPPQEPLNVPAPLRQVVLKAMAKRREERFQDMAQFARAIQACEVEPQASATAPRPPPFVAQVEGSTITLRFASEAAFEHVDRYELSAGRLFVPGSAPQTPGLLTLMVHVPGKPAMEAPATLLGIFDRQSAEKHGIPEGFALTIRGTFSVRHATLPPGSTLKAGQKPRAKRIAKRLPVAFGPTSEPAYLGVTTNISTRGLGVISPYVLPAGAALHLSITLPSKVLARAQGVVVWARSTSRTGDTGAMGIRLTTSDDRLRQFLADAATSAETQPPDVAGPAALPAGADQSLETTERIVVDARS